MIEAACMCVCLSYSKSSFEEKESEFGKWNRSQIEAVELIQSNKDDEHKFPHTKLDSLGTRNMPTADADAVVDADK